LTSEPEGHFVPEVRSQDRTKGQPEGSAVTGKTRKPGVANPGLESGNAAGQNNSNLTLYAASAANGEWELLYGIVPIIVLNISLIATPFYLHPPFPLQRGNSMLMSFFFYLLSSVSFLLLSFYFCLLSFQYLYLS
jgi:hypothetical protein